MKIEDALRLLDTEFQEPYGYGKVIIESRKRGLWLFNSKDGVQKCTRDWPQNYELMAEDFIVDDWEVKT